MKTKITWNIEGGVQMPVIDTLIYSEWLHAVAEAHGKILELLNYIFCSDSHILEVNRQYLNHDYFTDIITFDYSSTHRVSGDMYISLDTIATNALQFGQDYGRELNRVIVHGLLHLCGVNDKVREREIMERFENESLDILTRLTQHGV